jgi:RNA-binding protein 39
MSFDNENKRRDYDDYPYKGSKKGINKLYFSKIDLDYDKKKERDNKRFNNSNDYIKNFSTNKSIHKEKEKEKDREKKTRDKYKKRKYSSNSSRSNSYYSRSRSISKSRSRSYERKNRRYEREKDNTKNKKEYEGRKG